MRPTNAWWYVAALVVAFGGYMAGVATAGSAWNLATDATVQPVRTSVDAKDRAVAVFTDIPQPDRDVRCRTGGEGKPRKPIPESRIRPRTTQDGTTWTLIGILPSGYDGLYAVCAPKDGGTDPASYGLAAVDGFDSRVNLGNGITWLSVAAGLGLGVWTFLTRRRAAQEDDRA
ncbi:MAG: hypothetical protein PGN07_02175 [Aeromicrobium erythreum]